MIVKTKAIVLKTLKFKDTSLIIKCYTEQGIKSYILKGVLTAKKGKIRTAYFQPLNLLEIVGNHNNKGTLNTIKEVHLSYAYTTISNNIVKQSLVLFLSEVLNFALQEEEQNQPLFDFLFKSFQHLDAQKNVSNFHLLFLINLSKYLGFYPYKQNLNSLFFSLQEGVFQDSPSPTTITGSKLKLFKSLLGTDFDTMQKLKLNKEERQDLLDILISYFELHLSGFRKLNSIPVLQTVFN
jgi:DNA repair protein RecO (recombination protein O)